MQFFEERDTYIKIYAQAFINTENMLIKFENGGEGGQK